jgi:hypothetical protein
MQAGTLPATTASTPVFGLIAGDVLVQFVIIRRAWGSYDKEQQICSASKIRAARRQGSCGGRTVLARSRPAKIAQTSEGL